MLFMPIAEANVDVCNFCEFQVLLKCFTVLQEIPELLKQKRPATTAESLQHMVACMTYYLAKVLNALTTPC